MLQVLFAITASLYTLSAACFFGYALRGSEMFRRGAFYTLAASVLAHVVFIAFELGGGGASSAGVWKSLAVASLVLSVGYLGWFRTERFEILGVFITPVTLLLFLSANLGAHARLSSSGWLLPLHIGMNLFGIVLFSLASAAALAYVVQDRLLRSKRLGGLFRRLPALDELDATSFKLVTSGFMLYTVGIVSGVFFMAREGGGLALDGSRIAAFIAWVLFALVVFLRLAIGWRGRRAALATLLGFACTIIALLAYALRGDAG